MYKKLGRVLNCRCLNLGRCADRSKASGIGHVLPRNCNLKHFAEGRNLS